MFYGIFLLYHNAFLKRYPIYFLLEAKNKSDTFLLLNLTFDIFSIIVSLLYIIMVFLINMDMYILSYYYDLCLAHPLLKVNYNN